MSPVARCLPSADGPAPLNVGDEWSLPEELVALPAGSVVRDHDGDDWSKLARPYKSDQDWVGAGGSLNAEQLVKYGPGRVLYVERSA